MRASSIRDKLEDAKDQTLALNNVLHQAKFDENEFSRATHRVGEILSHITECFDYCIKDIYENLVYLYMSDSERENAVKRPIYFPFNRMGSFVITSS
jgi:hypothetical protein